MKKLLAVLLCAALLLLAFSACNGDSNPSGDGNPDGDGATVEKKDPIINVREETVDVKVAFEAKNGALPYRIYVPEDYSEEYAYPVLLFLHGAGERGNDNELQLKNVIQKLFDDPASPVYQSIVIVPQCPEGEQWVDTPWAEGSYSINSVAQSDEIAAVLSILDDVKSTYSVNEKRFYAMGISMGGFGTWDLMLRHGEMFAAAIPVCGGADPDESYRLIDKPIFTCHGDADTSVPVSGTREVVQAIKDYGGTNITYEELEGYGHNVWDYVAEKEGLMNWLFSQVLETE